MTKYLRGFKVRTIYFAFRSTDLIVLPSITEKFFICKFLRSFFLDVLMDKIFFPLTFEFKYLIVVSTSGSSGMQNKSNSNNYNITDIFETVSHAKYDLMNDVMSFGMSIDFGKNIMLTY